MVEAILWDNDGVLVDTERLYFQATRQALARARIELTLDLYKDISLRQGRSLFSLVDKKGWTAEQVAALRLERDEIYSGLLRAEPLLFPEVSETLRELHNKYRMAIVTSSRRVHFDVMHEKTEIWKYFEFVLAREDYGKSKPNPEPYLTALRRLGIAAEKSVAIEDTERGLSAARAAGLRCVVVPHEFTRGCEFAGAEAVIESVSELAGLLKRL
ncbi:MAG TPA: HAD family phosphatase [Terriglobales bacterium]|jgi:HAD superfamily hydrolase (TIGR01509 family)